MKAHLLYPDRDFDFEQALPANHEALGRDLSLESLFKAMAQENEFLFEVAKRVLLLAQEEGRDTVMYRQAVLQDALRHEEIVRALYGLTVEVEERRHKQWLGIISSYPAGILSGAVGLMEMFVDVLQKLRALADEHGGKFQSDGFRSLFAMLRAELSDDYFAEIADHLKTLRFPRGVLLSAELGPGNEGRNLMLRRSVRPAKPWLKRVLGTKPPSFTFRIDNRDEAGARALSHLQDQGINLVGNALAQSSDHVLSFFVMLRREVAFYLGGINLHRALKAKDAAVCFPTPVDAGSRAFACEGLRDAGLVLTLSGRVVGNDVQADGKSLWIVTGANQGGKSTFLRGIGVAQLMMQAGLFVAADSFRAELCRGIFTHYKREEDATMKSGKFDEELNRMNEIVGQLHPDALVLFNESFAATNEREGSEIARQIVRALLDARMKVVFVTHLYDFAHRFWIDQNDTALFLRAEREEDTKRTFKLKPGEPLPTSFGGDVFRAIFGDSLNPSRASSASPPALTPSPS